MNDNEVIKALKCCSSKKLLCSRCPNKKEGIDCVTLLSADTLNLIDRQNAEIERLQKDLDIINAANTELYGAFEENERLKSEIERLEKIRSELSKEVEGFADHNKQLRYDVKKIRTEARKEFVNMAKKHIYKNVSAPTPGQRYVMKKFTELLDNLVKEMEEET